MVTLLRPGGHLPRRAALLVSIALSLVDAVIDGSVAAHERSVSYSTWRLGNGRADVTLRMTGLDLSRVPPGTVPADRSLADWLADRLELLVAGVPCTPSAPARELAGAAGSRTFEWTLACSREGELRLRSSLLRTEAPSHLHFARIQRREAPATEVLLTSDVPERVLSTGSSAAPPSSLRLFVLLGVEHILSGLDHLAFLAALLLAATSLGEMTRAVTGFTVGHSLTLAAATLGWVHADRLAVDALIGASIALVAFENLRPPAASRGAGPWVAAAALVGLGVSGVSRVPPLALGGLAAAVVCSGRAVSAGASGGVLRWGMAALFGLVHGLGFASVLAEAALPPERLALALLGFNLGVEAGQVLLVLAAWPLLATLRRRPALGALATDAGNAVLLGAGLCWFLVRAHAGS